MLQHLQTLFKTENRSIDSKIEHVIWSANKLAFCMNSNNQITLFDGNSMEKKEKFSAKTNLGLKNGDFHVKGLAFSADGTKIAVGQTDCVIHVYKIGSNWGEKKSIIGKYTLQSQVTCLRWIHNGIVFGTSDGKIKLIQTTSNRMSNIYSHTSPVISLSAINDKVCAAFLDEIVVICLSRTDDVFRCKTSFPAFALWLVDEQCLAYGTNSSLTILELNRNSTSRESSREQTNDDSQVLELNSTIYHLTSLPNGGQLVCACAEEFHLFTRENHLWSKKQTIVLSGYGLINSLSLSPDGTRLITTSVNGLVDLFELKWKKSVISRYFEINFMGSNQISIKNSKESDLPEMNVLIRSKSEIKQVKILKRRYAIVWTRNSLIFSDLEVATSNANLKQFTEIDWSGMSTNEVRFCFEFDSVVLINVIGELYIFQLSNGQLLTSVRTDFISPHLMSVRINESSNKRFAYLLDEKTIVVVDLMNSKQLASFNHTECVDWIELSETGKQLLIRDKQLNLYLCNLEMSATGSKSAGSSRTPIANDFQHLLSKCIFVQWVPLSDVVIGQSRDKLYVFFDFEKPKIYELSSTQQATGIVRQAGESKVLLIDDEGKESSIELNETYLEFDTALQNGELRKAMFFLENQTDSTSIWKRLNDVAFQYKDYLVLERSLAAIGDLVKSQYVHDCASDNLKRVIFQQDWPEFENTNDFETVIKTYRDLYKWNSAIEYANRMGNHERKGQLEQEYYDHLMKNGREFEAGQICEHKGDFIEAIRLYLKSSRVLDASRIIFLCWKKGEHLPAEILQQTVEQLKRNQFYEEAGHFYEQNVLDVPNNDELALECYKKGNLFDLAIELSRKKFPMKVVSLEEEFGDYLVSRNDYERAISHYIESGSNEKALNCALKALDYEKAAELALVLASELRPEICKKIADHYLKTDLETAIKLYLNAGFISEAVKLLNEQKQFTRAFRLVKEAMSMGEEDAREMFLKIGTQFETEGKLKDAETIYLLCDQADKAISMYKDAKQYESMIKLVEQYHPDLLIDTHRHLAKELERDKFYSKAELHYVQAGEWKHAIQMYKKINRMEEAYRIARSYGGNTNVVRQVALVWAKSLPTIDDAVKMLNKYGLMMMVIDEAVENEMYDFARLLAKQIGENKLNEINLKWATKLEEEGKHSEAERLYLESGKAREAVLMYLHLGQFQNAIQIAENEVKDDHLVRELLTNEAKSILLKHESILSRGDVQEKINLLKKVESLLIKAGKPELIINLYKQHRLYDEALKVSEQHATHLISTVRREMQMLSNQSNYTQRSTDEDESDLSNLRRERPSPLNGSLELSCEQLEDKLEIAQRSNNKEDEATYALMLGAKHVSMSNYVQALNVVNKYNVLLVLEDTRKLVMRISTRLFAMEHIDLQPDSKVWRLLRDTLFSVLISKSTNNGEELEKHLLVAHFLCLKCSLSNHLRQLSGSESANKLKNNSIYNSLSELNLKLSIALLRYTDLVRVDYLFYEAGQLCREANRINFAFVFLNHFLDLVDAIAEQDANLVDYSDLEQTDIPSQVPLPSALFQGDRDGEQQIEQVKSWILEKSMDNLTYSLLTRSHNDSNSAVYEASLVQADGRSMVCLVTGYPVLETEHFDLKPGKYAANRSDWNQLIMIIKVTCRANSFTNCWLCVSESSNVK